MMKPLFLIVGPSGSGKTTLAWNLFHKYELVPVVSYSTRPMRANEVDGRDHNFISNAEFNQLKNLVAYTEFNDHKYGVTEDMINNCDTYVIDPAGVSYLKKHLKNRPIVVIGIEVSQIVCMRRMQQRGDSYDKVLSRISHDAQAFEHLSSYCDVMIDGTTDIETLTTNCYNVIKQFVS